MIIMIYIIIEFIQGNYDNFNFVLEDGKVIPFDTEEQAETHAKRVCNWNYKIIGFDW